MANDTTAHEALRAELLSEAESLEIRSSEVGRVMCPPSVALMRRAAAVLAPREQPAAQEGETLKRAFVAACTALAEIGEALGLSEEVLSNPDGNEEMLEEIERLKALAARAESVTQDAETGSTGAWQPIETAPKDGSVHVRGLWVRLLRDGKPDEYEWREHVGYYEDGAFIDIDYRQDFGWEPEDFDAWLTLPPPPARNAAPTQDAAHGGRGDG